MISLDTFIGGMAGQKLQASGPMAAAWGGAGGAEGVVTMVNLISMFFNPR